ncbi:MAG: PAS domain S-box protein [Caldilineaceae bacterium]|nr:PAS domain S-box protein [Caldilineaceae bacterium]
MATYQLRQREYLLRITRAMTSRLDLPSLLTLILNSAAEMVSCRAGLIALERDVVKASQIGADSTRFEIRATYNIAYRLLSAFEPLLDIDTLIASDQGEDDDDQFGHSFLALQERVRQVEEKLDLPLGQVVGLPLLFEDELLGIIYLFRSDYAFTQMDWQLLQGFANQAAVAVRNARLYHQLETERSRLATIIENSANGIMILDANRFVVVMNQALAAMVGIVAEDAVGRSCREVLALDQVVGEDLCQAEASLDTLAKDGVRCEGDLLRPGGGRLIVSVTYTPLHNELGELVNIIVNVHDITRFREEEEIKSTFTSIISHELKTPVALIKGYAQTLARPDAEWDQETAQQSLQISRKRRIGWRR